MPPLLFGDFKEIMLVLINFFNLVVTAIYPPKVNDVIQAGPREPKISYNGDLSPFDVREFCQDMDINNLAGLANGGKLSTILTPDQLRWFHLVFLPRIFSIGTSDKDVNSLVRSLNELKTTFGTIIMKHDAPMKPHMRADVYGKTKRIMNANLSYLKDHLCGGDPTTDRILELFDSIPDFPKQVPSKGLYHPECIRPFKFVTASSSGAASSGAASSGAASSGGASASGASASGASASGASGGAAASGGSIVRRRMNWDGELLPMRKDDTNPDAIIFKAPYVQGPDGKMRPGVCFSFDDVDDMLSMVDAAQIGKLVESRPPHRSMPHSWLGKLFVSPYVILTMEFRGQHGLDSRAIMRSDDPRLIAALTSFQTHRPDTLAFLDKPISLSHPGVIRALGQGAIRYQLLLQRKVHMFLSANHQNPSCHFAARECWRPECPGYGWLNIYEKPRSIRVQGQVQVPPTDLRCKDCNHSFCTKCHKPSHGGVCDQPDEASRDFIAQTSKPCPTCDSDITKDGGCNHITCLTCRTHFCWICGLIYSTDANGHIMVTEHYQNGDAFGACIVALGVAAAVPLAGAAVPLAGAAVPLADGAAAVPLADGAGGAGGI
jgi:hypothetical protein